MNPLTPISEAEFVAFDLETTGLHPVSSQIVELGAVRFKGDGEVLGQFQQLVDPKSKIPHIATQIHGITNAMVQGQPSIAEALPEFLEFLGDAPIVMLRAQCKFRSGIFVGGPLPFAASVAGPSDPRYLHLGSATDFAVPL